MGWFTHHTNPITTRAHELSCEIEKLKEQITVLQDASHSENPVLIRTTIEKTTRVSNDPILRNDEVFLKDSESKAKRVGPSLYNEQGVRKFDLHGLWLKMKQSKPLPEPNQNEKLITYLATGRNHGYTALRKETRVARNRFILLTLILVSVLWSILSLLIPQL